MLGDKDVAAALPVTDVESAKDFYVNKLGLTVVSESPGGVVLRSGGSNLFVYPSENAGTNKGTAAGWQVDDARATAAELKQKGVVFEDYDLPYAKRDGDVYLIGDSVVTTWFKDPAGNILAINSGDM